MPRVRIAGMGIISCYGNGTQAVVGALRAARTGITPLSRFSLPSQAEIKVNQIDQAHFPHSKGIEALVVSTLRQTLAETEWSAMQEPIPDCALVLGSSGFLFTAEMDYRQQPGA